MSRTTDNLKMPAQAYVLAQPRPADFAEVCDHCGALDLSTRSRHSNKYGRKVMMRYPCVREQYSDTSTSDTSDTSDA